MANSRFGGLVQTGISLHRTLTELQYAERARQKADALDSYMPVAQPSGVLGDARLADMTDLEDAHLFNPKGLFIGAFQGRMLFYSGTEPGITYLKTGGGKGRDFLLTNAAHVRDRNLVFVDCKDGENAAVSSHHRTTTLGIPTIRLNPFDIRNEGNICINPMQSLIHIIYRGDTIEDEADEIAHTLVPISPKANDPWPQEGARELIAMLLEYFAVFDQDECRPGGLWKFFNASAAETDRRFKMMTTCRIESIERAAHGLYAIYQDAPKQYAAYRSVANKCLRPFAAGKPLDRATSKNEFDFARLKNEIHTIYIMLPSRKLSTAAIWVSLILNHMIEEIAHAHGPLPTTLMIDEFAQIPASPAILKAVQLYREKGVQPWFFAQSRDTLREKWPDSAIREFESQSGFMTMKQISEPGLMKDISYWSGTRSIILHGKNHSGGKLETASQSLSESKRAVLQAEDIMELAQQKQIVKVSGMPRLLVCHTVPFTTVSPWKDQIQDVRKLHRGDWNPFKRLPPAT